MLTVIHHPLIDVKLDIMRDERTKAKEFREALEEIASLMTFEVFKDVPTYESDEIITTPTGVSLPKTKLQRKIVLAPILRAGIGMVDGVRNMIPTARVGHIGIYRDEKTLEPHEYYFKLPEVQDPIVCVIDPMLATGGSACDAIRAIKKRHYSNNIRLMCLVGVQQGIDAVEKEFPDVHIYLAAKDEKLNENGYILPGLGDAGDRIFGTK